MDFGQKLVKARKDSGMTQEELAGAVHVTRSTISSWERRRTRPDLDSVLLLSSILKCDFMSDGAPDEKAVSPIEIAPQTPAPSARRGRIALIIGVSAAVTALIICFIFILLPALRNGESANGAANTTAPVKGDAVRLGPTDLPGAVEIEPEKLLLEEPEVFTIEWFKQDNPIASGEPYLRFRTKLSVMGPETSSAGVTMWDWDLLFYEMTGRMFTLTRVDEYAFSSRQAYRHFSYDPGLLWYEDGPEAHWEFGGRMPVQPFQGYGYIVYGTDEAGNELSFRAWFDLSTAPTK